MPSDPLSRDHLTRPERAPRGSPLIPRSVVIGATVALVLVQSVAIIALATNHVGRADPTAPAPSAVSTAGPERTTTTTAVAATGSTTPINTNPSAPVTPPTIEEILCSSAGGDPATAAELLFQAYNLGDRACADAVATPEAIDALFGIPGSGFAWEFAGCDTQLDPATLARCRFTHIGGATVLEMSQTSTGSWEMTAVVDEPG